MNRMLVRFPIPFPQGIPLGVTVRCGSPVGPVVGTVVSILRAPVDPFMPPGVLLVLEPVEVEVG